jgi:hypothetical protein
MASGKKRSSPGADTTKNGDPFAEVDIGDAEESILTEYQKKIQRVELILGGYTYPHICYHPKSAVLALLIAYSQNVVLRSS